jgi:S1-C subfamily serine protease
MLVAASAVTQAQTPARAGAVMRRQPMTDTTGRDSIIRIQVEIGPNELAKMVAELVASRATEERIAMSLHEARADRGEAARARELENQLMQLVRRNSGLASAIRMQCARDGMQPEGYMGLNFVGIEVRKYGDGPALYYFGDNPQIVSVDPGSPAQKAGIEPGDEVIAINGSDARKPVPLEAYLKPNMRIAVRYSRDGKTREATVVVAKRPDDNSTPCAEVNEIVGARGYMPQTIMLRRSEAPSKSGPQGGVVASAVPPTEEGPYRRQGPGGFNFSVTPFPAMGAPSMIAGAAFLTLDADWRETLGVDKGLLVTVVAMGSPAQTAGLKKGDIVVSAGDATIASTGALWRIVNTNGANGVTLKVMRAGKPVSVTLKPKE